MLRSAPKFYEVAKRIVEITEDCIIVAHNAQFDNRILKMEFKRLGFGFKRETLCTVELAKKLIPGQESYSLGKLARALGIPVSDRHRADGDAAATLKLFKILLNKDVEKYIIQDSVRMEPKYQMEPNHKQIIEALPSITGIPATAPISPRPRIAVPLVTMATWFGMAVYLYASSGERSISLQMAATPGV